MKYLAMLRDSFLEALDCKSLYVMMIVSFLFIVVLASFSYSPTDPATALQDLTANMTMVHGGSDVGSFWVRRHEGITFEVTEIRELGMEEKGFAEGYAFKLTASPVDRFDRLVRHWDAVERNVVRKEADPVPDGDKPATPELRTKFLRFQFFLRQIPRVNVESQGEGTFAIKVKPSSKKTLAGAYRCHYAFGLGSFPLSVSVALWIYGLELFLSQYMAGLFGVLIGIIFTADFVPNMLQKGRIDLLLARPISRVTILIYKYLGGILYAGLTGAVFIGGSFLVLSVRSGVWNWGYLASLGTLVLFFAVLSSVGTLTAVVTRNTVASIIVPLFAWLLGFGVTWVKNQGRDQISMFNVPAWVDRGLEFVSYFLPRASDFNEANRYFMQKYAVGDEILEIMKQTERLPDIPWVTILASSGLFILVMLTGACWIFSRRDH